MRPSFRNRYFLIAFHYSCEDSYRVHVFIKPVLYLFAALDSDTARLFVDQAADFPPRLKQGNACQNTDADNVEDADDYHQFNADFHHSSFSFAKLTAKTVTDTSVYPVPPPCQYKAGEVVSVTFFLDKNLSINLVSGMLAYRRVFLRWQSRLRGMPWKKPGSSGNIQSGDNAAL
jgi:hypothetical protein